MYCSKIGVFRRGMYISTDAQLSLINLQGIYIINFNNINSFRPTCGMHKVLELCKLNGYTLNDKTYKNPPINVYF